MTISYFRRRAAQAYRAARSSLRPHLDYEALIRLGDEFKRKAAAAAARLDRRRRAPSASAEAEQQHAHRDRRE